MIRKEIKENSAFAEFDPQAQEYWFDFSKEKVVPHIDTFYYTVSIYNDSSQNTAVGRLLDRLQELRALKILNRSEEVKFSYKEETVDVSIELGKFSNYDFCLRLNENFDIFISSVLPNSQTPRIVVQLRTRMLVLEGVTQAIQKSFEAVRKILYIYGLHPQEVRENRIDYAYHTNLIQNPYQHFSDEYIIEKLKSKLRLYHKVGNIRGDKIEIDYFSLGNRKSNNVFVRIYNKSQEVVEKNYKSFFITRWREEKLISRYDEYVYEKAYQYKSYYTGVLVGRIDWYLEHGSDERIRAELQAVKLSCYENSDNIEQLQKVVNRYLPPVTLIMNVEFQTKRKFYLDSNKYIEANMVNTENDPLTNQPILVDDTKNPLRRLLTIYDLRAEFCHYLTNETLCFVDNKGKKTEKLCYWWKRIVDCQIKEYKRKVADVWRERETHIDKKRAERRLMSDVAYLAFLNQNTNEEQGFVEDLSDALCSLNDNDFYGFAADPKTGEVFDFSLEQRNAYSILKKRKSRQINGILKQNKKTKNNTKVRKKYDN